MTRTSWLPWAKVDDRSLLWLRISGPNFLTPDPKDTASVAQDVELEHIATSVDSRIAWIPLPENNALAVLDVSKGEVRDIVPFGVKDHSLLNNGLDPSDADGGIKIGPWPVNGMYMPTQVATYNIGSEMYFVSANSGTHRDYEAFDDRVTVKEVNLDGGRFPDAEFLQKTEHLGNLRVSDVDGDYDGDADFDAIFAFGGRSFSIRSANGLRYVSDSWR
jgi:hypothetical protein